MHDGGLHALHGKAGRRFEAEQAAADHHRVAALASRGQHGIDVVEIAEGDDARQVDARHRDQDRPRADGDHQGVVALALAGVGADGFGGAVDGDDGFAPAQVDAVAFVPGVVMDDDVLELLFA